MLRDTGSCLSRAVSCHSHQPISFIVMHVLCFHMSLIIPCNWLYNTTLWMLDASVWCKVSARYCTLVVLNKGKTAPPEARARIGYWLYGSENLSYSTIFGHFWGLSDPYMAQLEKITPYGWLFSSSCSLWLWRWGTSGPAKDVEQFCLFFTVPQPQLPPLSRRLRNTAQGRIYRPLDHTPEVGKFGGKTTNQPVLDQN